MSDIVERLKYCAEHGLIDAASSEMAAGYGEAAAEIEKLRAELEKSRQDWERVDTAHSFRVHESEMRQVDIFALEAENEKLRAAIFEKETVMQIRAAAAAALKETGDE